MRIATVAIIGAGPAGLWFAERCLAAGFAVVLEDVMPANLRSAAEVLGEAARRGRLATARTVEDAVRDADVAIDFVPDELESKLEIFSMIDRMAPPRTILCTPSEVLSIADLASCTYRAERCFALRGLARVPRTGAAGVTLSFPSRADASVLADLELFLDGVGLRAQTEPDRAEPQLTRVQPEPLPEAGG